MQTIIRQRTGLFRPLLPTTNRLDLAILRAQWHISIIAGTVDSLPRLSSNDCQRRRGQRQVIGIGIIISSSSDRIVRYSITVDTAAFVAAAMIGTLDSSSILAGDVGVIVSFFVDIVHYYTRVFSLGSLSLDRSCVRSFDRFVCLWVFRTER
mmetsp:Transcript_60274/g.68311  ORF Transcript_60274/g.68311 Transcript_60274/m.68311 type:complete len:152 (+) Transcript_60274:265-720(+)